MRGFVLLVVLVVIAVTAACSQEHQWREEALQADGSKVVVERSILMGARRAEPGQSTTGVVGQVLTFTNPSNGESVRWENPGKLRPMIVAIVQGIPYIVAAPVSVYGYIEAGCPQPAYIFFKYSGGWRKISYREFPKEVVNRNLLLVHSYKDLQKIKGRLVTNAQIVSTYPNTGLWTNQIDPTYPGPPHCVMPHHQGR